MGYFFLGLGASDLEIRVHGGWVQDRVFSVMGLMFRIQRLIWHKVFFKERCF